MKKPKIIRIFLITIFIISHYSCTNKKIESLSKNEVYADSIFTNKFDMRKPGFTGGDATYSVLLPDGRTVWIFGDTFIGEASPELTREKTNPMYIRNCFVVQNGDDMKTLHKGKHEDFISMAIPNEVENLENSY